MPKPPTNGHPEDKTEPMVSQAETRRPARSWPSAAELQAMDATERGIWERLIANTLW